MKAKTISYKRIKSLGNYESETLEIQVELDKTETVATAFKRLRDKVESLLELKEPNDDSDIPF